MLPGCVFLQVHHVVLRMERVGSRMPFKLGSRHAVSAFQINFIVADATLMRLQRYFILCTCICGRPAPMFMFSPACLASGRLTLFTAKEQKQHTHTRTPNYCARGYDQFFCSRQIYLCLMILHIACASYCWRVFVVCMRLGSGRLTG